MKPKFEFNGIKPAFINGGFRAFVQTVLPTIYDDSLSYYELLNKVVKHLNNIVSDVATLNTNQENFIEAVTNFINETAVETYDIDITNPLDPAQMQLSAADATALFNAIENDKIVRVFVHSASGTIYTCYYYTIVPNDNEQNNLYFAGFSFSQYETNPNVVPWKIVKIKRSGAITIYDNVNAVTKKYVDDSINNATATLAERIDAIVEKAPYKVYFDVYPDPDNARNYIVASDETPLALSMIDAEGNDIECYMVSKASAEGIVIDTVKADTIVFGQSGVYITFDNVDYNPNEPTNTIYKKGYNVIHGNKTDNVWAYQAFAKTRGKVEFNITISENNQATITSFSHTPEEVYRLFSDYGGYVPCDIYINSPITGSEANYAIHSKTSAVVTSIEGEENWFIGVTFDDLTNGTNSLDVTHYTIEGVLNSDTWSLSFRVYEYPNANEMPLVEKISVDDLPNVSNGVYTLGTVDVSAPIRFPRVQNRGIVIVDTVFNINTTVLFPAYREDTYFSIPTFIGCTFNNATNGRVLITSGSNDLVGNRFTGCNFNNVDCAESVYIQDFNFTNCYIQSYQTFLNCDTSTVQARFVNCDVEASCKEVVNAKKAFVYASGTYEGNSQQNYYFFNAAYGVLNFVSAWLESTKLCKITGGSRVQDSTVLKFDGCDVQINTTPMVSVDNPQYVNIVINSSSLIPFSKQSVFIDKTPEQLMSVKGDFIHTYNAGYVKPIGGVLAEDKELATIADVKALENKRFYYQRLLMNQAAMQAGGIDITLSVGRWLIFSGRGDAIRMDYAYANPESGTQANVRNVIPPVPTNEAYTSALRFTATKETADSSTFTLKVTATEAAWYELSAIKIS